MKLFVVFVIAAAVSLFNNGVVVVSAAEELEFIFSFPDFCEICSEIDDPPFKFRNGDKVTLKWERGAPHNVWKFDNVNAYKNCDFTQAEVVPGCYIDEEKEEKDEEPWKYGVSPGSCTIPTDTNGVSYYGCGVRDHCEDEGMKLAVVTRGKPGNIRG